MIEIRKFEYIVENQEYLKIDLFKVIVKENSFALININYLT